jgi:hypothetical protein
LEELKRLIDEFRSYKPVLAGSVVTLRDSRSVKDPEGTVT